MGIARLFFEKDTEAHISITSVKVPVSVNLPPMPGIIIFIKFVKNIALLLYFYFLSRTDVHTFGNFLL